MSNNTKSQETAQKTSRYLTRFIFDRLAKVRIKLITKYCQKHKKRDEF